MKTTIFNRYISPILPLLSAITLLLLGLVFLSDNQGAIWEYIGYLAAAGLTIYGLMELLIVLTEFKRKKILINFLSFIGSITMAIVFLLNYNRPFAFIALLFGIWTLLNAFIQGLNYFFVYRADKLKQRFWVLIDFLWKLIYGLVLTSNPLFNYPMLSYVLAIYLFLASASEMFKFYNILRYKNYTDNLFSLPVPVLIAAIIPSKVYQSINQLLEKKEIIALSQAIADKNKLEVFFYIQENGPESFGHTDISFEGTIYSYGCHDPHKRTLFGGLGDGVLIVCPKEDFINFSLNDKPTTIIQFSIQLNDQQTELIRTRINQLLARTVPFQSDAQLQISDAQDYLSRVYRKTKAASYKFTSGIFKTYFVLTTNCVQLADHILNMKELNLFNFQGIITPGTYFKFLYDQYKAKTIVADLTIYQKKITEK